MEENNSRVENKGRSGRESGGDVRGRYEEEGVSEKKEEKEGVVKKLCPLRGCT